ncbi:MAG TPA: hypothetical protein VII95_10830 [Terriglobales bacterium]|jgi:hypothetical protein
MKRRTGFTTLFLGITALAIVASMGTTANAQILTLTPAGISLGFTLSTFATLDPGNTGCCDGPFGVALAAPDRVLVYNAGNGTRYVFHDVDGQTRGSAITSTTLNQTGALAYATAGGLAYGGTSQFGQFAQYDTSGNVIKILTGVPQMTLRGMWGNPVDGHILATTFQETIIDINPSGTGSSRTVTSGSSFAWDGLTVSPDGKTVYGVSSGSILGYNIATGNQVFNSGLLAGGPDGMGVISSNNQLNGDLIVNFNGNGVNTGFVGLLNPNTLQLTVIASGGTRGDYASPDPTNGTLFLDYSDKVYRLSCGPNCSLGGVPNGYVEICKASCPLHPVTGLFTFTAINGGFNSGPLTVPVGACTAPIQVPSGTVTINEAVRLGYEVTNIGAYGYNVFGQRENRLLSSNLPFQTANVRVVAGDVSTETVATFTNCASGPGELKICKVAGSGVTVGTYFTFTVTTGIGFPQTYVVPAGPAPGGYCVVAGSYPVGTRLLVRETVPPGVFVSNIAVAPPDRGGTQTSNSVIVAINSGTTEATFTDTSSRACSGANLLTNGDFETGDFFGWTEAGNFTGTAVVSGSFYVYPGAESGMYYAVLGPVGSDGTLSQRVATTAGRPYTICFWLNAVGDHPSDFSAFWDGTALLSLTDPNTGGGLSHWKQYILYPVTGTGSDTLTFSFRDDPGYIALDNVSVQ